MSASEEQGQGEGPVIRDRRRIDPVTGQPRVGAQPGASAADQPPRGAGQPRPGKHAVSKPGSAKAATPEFAATNGPGDTGAAQAAADQDAKSGQNGTGQDTPGQGSPAQDSPGQVRPGRDRNDGKTGTAEGQLAIKLAERTADLQRLQAEYANYRKRVERDRGTVRDLALATVIAELLPVLDDIGRAREHGELTGGFKAVAESLEAAAGKLGLTTFGEAGEEFDPNVHEALLHSYSPEVTETTCVQILQPGYKFGERILRPARVAVAEPTDPAGARTGTSDEPGESQGAGDATSDGAAQDAAAAPDAPGAPGAPGANAGQEDGSAETEGHAADHAD
jgi:molecular chaperone GrpE